MLWIVDGGMINLPAIARVEDFKEDSYIEITGANENHEWKSEPTRYEKVVRCKDCKLWQICNLCMRYGDDWFCAGGERKDDGR